MSFGLTATLLLRLDARLGQWERIEDLASHCAVPVEAAAAELERMHASGLVLLERDLVNQAVLRAMADPGNGPPENRAPVHPEAALINELSRRQGRENGIGAADLARTLGITERQVRSVISTLREDGMAICATPETGYFLAVTPEELRESCKFLHARAMKSLRLASQMQRISLPELLGQLFLNQA